MTKDSLSGSANTRLDGRIQSRAKKLHAKAQRTQKKTGTDITLWHRTGLSILLASFKDTKGLRTLPLCELWRLCVNSSSECPTTLEWIREYQTWGRVQLRAKKPHAKAQRTQKKTGTDITLWRGTRLSIFLAVSYDTKVLTNSSPLRALRLCVRFVF